MPVHLADRLEEAEVSGARIPEDPPDPVEWRFGEPQPGWKAARYDALESLTTKQLADALRIHLAAREPRGKGALCSQGAYRGLAYVDLPQGQIEPWGHLIVRGRTEGGAAHLLRVALDLGESAYPGGDCTVPFETIVRTTTLIGDGAVQTYRVAFPGDERQARARQLVLAFYARRPAAFDLVSVTAVPRAAAYADAPAGVRTVARGDHVRRALFLHAPGRLEFDVQVPEQGRLDTALAGVDPGHALTFRVAVSRDGERDILLEKTLDVPAASWQQQSIDLAAYAGQQLTLALEAESDGSGQVALWGAPTLTGRPRHDSPNVILYVVDGAGADWMSLYGYNRRTTPLLERLAAEGVVFERAYSNATWTKLSNPSFLTSLYPSALGFFHSLSDRVPEAVPRMADHFRRAGYLTAFFTSNVVGCTLSGLEQGPDVVWAGPPPVECLSSETLHREFQDWRKAYPSGPFFVHFQTTDVHEPFDSRAPFAGLFLEPQRRAEYFRWDRQIDEVGGWDDPRAYAKLGITPERYALAQQALYDECMAHQDHELGRLVSRLKASGDWANTILIVTADHGYPAGSHRLMEPMAIGAPYFHPFATRIPLLVIWPGRIPGGIRLSEPVSLIDLLPTLLDLSGLAPPSLTQGRSLAPSLLEGVEPDRRHVIIDMPSTDFDTGELIGTLEVVDGRWGASLVFSSRPPGQVPNNRARHGDALEPHYARSEPLVVYDLQDDPFCTRSVNAERPDLVERYRQLLQRQRSENLALRSRLGRTGDTPLDPEMLERLRTLGYVE
jgi:arylsulfatase A-like enzyme